MRSIAASFLVLISTQLTSAQPTESTPVVIVKNSLQHFSINSLKLGVERLYSTRKKSLAFFVTARDRRWGYTYEGYRGLSGEIQYRKYIRPMKENFSRRNIKFYQGVYLAGFVQGGMYTGKFDEHFYWHPGIAFDYREDISNCAAGFMFGIQRSVWEVIFIDAFLGGGFQSMDRDVSGPRIPANGHNPYSVLFGPQHQGILPKIGVQIGIAL